MDHHEGIQPESIKPGPPSVPVDALREGPAPVPGAPGTDVDDEPGFFTPTNIVLLGMMVALGLYLLYKFHLEELGNILKAVLGLSFVIFIHELGHFLAAKWADVNVTTFSIGFGPPIPGCSFTWGETTYKLAVIPLGGYVQMVGQVDGDEGADGSEDDPRSYRNKSVGQRMLIISAGVIMNAILAVVCFIIVYMGPGKEHPAGVILQVDTAAPAFQEGLRTGAKITHFGGKDDANFTDLMQTVINSRKDQKIPMSFQLKDQPPVSTQLEAMVPEETSDRPTRPMIGVASPPRLQLISRRLSREGPFVAGSPAHLAGFEPSDRIIAMTDPDKGLAVTELPKDWRAPADMEQRDYFEFARRLQLLADKEIVVRVERTTEDEKIETVDLKVKPLYRVNLGMRMQMGPILAVRKDSPAAKENVKAPDPVKKLEGDLIEAVTAYVKDDKGNIAESKEFKDDKLDPERLPLELRQWSDRLDREKIAGKRFVELQVRRHSDQPGKQYSQVKLELGWDANWRFDRAYPMSINSPMAIPELGLAYQVKTTVAGTSANSPLKVGDIVKNVRYEYQGHDEQLPEFREFLYTVLPFLRPEHDTDVKTNWFKEDLKDGQWAFISHGIFQSTAKIKSVAVKVERDKAEQTIEIPITEDTSWPLADRGWYLAGDTRRVKASDPIHAVWMGFVDTHNRMMEVFQNIRGMVTGRISVKNLGGPLTIARATYIFAGMDFGEFAFFLGLISINLAVVNFLPIPVLDGGHMVFLIYEKLRGQPASEAVRIWATYAGLIIIGCLMLFVLYLDVTRLFL